MTDYSGVFITLEGPEGSGKSTQAVRLAKRLQETGYKTVLTHEPGGTLTGDHIRHILLNKNIQMCPETEILLYAADRAQHVRELIIPALQEGSIVICDRFSDSSLAYQGFARGLGVEFVQDVNFIAAGSLVPDLSLFYDISAEKGLSRKHSVSFDRMEHEDISFHESVRSAYLEIAAREPHRVKLIDAAGDIESIARASLSAVLEIIKR